MNHGQGLAYRTREVGRGYSKEEIKGSLEGLDMQICIIAICHYYRTVVGRSNRFAAPSDNMGDRGPGLVAVVYCHATYLFVYNFSHVVIMSVHDSVLIADFLVVLEWLIIFSLSVSYFGVHCLCLRPCWITLTGSIFQNYL